MAVVPGLVTTRQTRLNIRSGPSVSNAIVGKLQKGEAVFIDTDTQSFDGSGYLWVKLADGRGWSCIKDPNYNYVFITFAVQEAEEAVQEDTAVEEAEKVDEAYDGPFDINAFLSNLSTTNTGFIGSYEAQGIDGSAVMYEDQKYDAELDDLWINVHFDENKNRGRMSDDSLNAIERMTPSINEPTIAASTFSLENGRIIPKTGSGKQPFYQNEFGYPRIKHRPGEVNGKNYYTYDYSIDYNRDNLAPEFTKLRIFNDLDIEGRDELFRQQTEYYNRFKLPNPNDALSKAYAHVFFVRPDCNILERSSGNFVLTNQCQGIGNYIYTYEKSPELLRQLVGDAGYESEFMMYLSNKVISFDLKAESIKYDTYGRALTGHKIAYGKENVESKTAGSFSVTFQDDRDLHVFQLAKIWTDYISDVYQGKLSPKFTYMRDKILDYVSAVYYILTAEDGETIIFWSKFFGVFPVEVPSNTYSWTAGNLLKTPTPSIDFQYSFKKDCDPLSLVEFNMISGAKDYQYIPIINTSDKFTRNTTWVRAPFIETFNDSLHPPYTMKLRFRTPENRL